MFDVTDRRSFFKRMATVLLGGAAGLVALPQIAQAQNSAGPLGQKQLHLMLAAKKFMEKTEMLRAMGIFQYGNDGEILSDWSVALPPENEISPDADNLAQRILAMVGQ
jgi:hypothetical protein